MISDASLIIYARSVVGVMFDQRKWLLNFVSLFPSGVLKLLFLRNQHCIIIYRIVETLAYVYVCVLWFVVSS